MDVGDFFMKASRQFKQRVRLSTAADKKKIAAAAKLLAEYDAITLARANMIVTWSRKGGY